jgi:3-hydroxyisobutyrate dehydrogenase-like beta-hydroxyacid dehydrogenase
MAVADGLGVDLRTFYDTVANSGAATVSGLFKETGGRIVERRFDNPVFTVELLCKDAGLALEMARTGGIEPRIAGFVQDLNLAARDDGLACEDTSALYKWFLRQ